MTLGWRPISPAQLCWRSLGMSVGPDGSIFLDQQARPVELIRYAPGTGRLQRTPAIDRGGVRFRGRIVDLCGDGLQDLVPLVRPRLSRHESARRKAAGGDLPLVDEIGQVLGDEGAEAHRALRSGRKALLCAPGLDCMVERRVVVDRGSDCVRAPSPSR